MPFSFWLSQHASHFIDQLSSRRRRRVLDECTRIAASPLVYDRQENQRGFLTYYRRAAGWLFIYRLDEPVERVMIADIIDLK